MSRKFPGEVLLYLNLPKPARLVQNTQELRDCLDSQAEVKLLISHSNYRKELMEGLPAAVPAEPTLKERVYPWEKANNYEAWIIRTEGE